MTMRVLLLRPVMELGGVARHMSLLGQGLQDRGIGVLIATSPGGGLQRLPRFWERDISCRLNPSTVVNLVSSAAKLARVVREEEVSVLHSHHRFTSMVGRLVSSLTSRPLVVTLHEFTSSHRSLARFFSGDVTIVPSDALKRHLIAHYRLDSQRIVTIPNGVPLSKPDCAESGGANARRRDPEAPPVVGFIGRLSREKGARFFIESLPLIRRRHPSVKFRIVGSGPEETELKALAGTLGLDPASVFLGELDDIGSAISALDVLVVPSLEESFGLVILEAMRESLPVVASSVGGIPEVVKQGETGILVPPGSPTAIADAVMTLVESPAEAKRLGQGGRILLEESFGVATMVERTVETYRRVLRAKGRSLC